jgi:hypothetical protein
MCDGNVRSNIQQLLMHGIVKPIMPYIARKYLRLRNATYDYKALIFCCFLIKQKAKEKNIQSDINKNNQISLKSHISKFVCGTSK